VNDQLNRKSLKSGLLTLVLTVILVAVIGFFNDGRIESIKGRPAIADGDSLVLAGRRIRLLGLDAPELAQTCRQNGENRPCGRMARNVLRDLVGGRSVRCESDAEDRYGRLLATCHVVARDLGELLVEAGWAGASGDYGGKEARARDAGRGLWAMEFVRPAQWRAEHGRDGEPGFWSSLWN